VLLIGVAVALEVRSEAIGLVGVMVAAAFGLAGPVIYPALRRRAP